MRKGDERKCPGPSPPPFHLLIWPVLLSVLVGVIGIDWGVPSNHRVRLLFQDQSAFERTLPEIAAETADVMKDREEGPVWVKGRTGTGEGTAWPGEDITRRRKTLLKTYRAYLTESHSYDEVWVFKALSRMNPGQGDLNPRFYQYGGAFLYPTGAALFFAAQLGIVHVSKDAEYYLRNPGEFGKFYVVGRLVSVAGVALGVFFLVLLGGLLSSGRWSVLGSFLLALLPAVVTWEHEVKPHAYALGFIAGTAFFSVRYAQSHRLRHLCWAGVFGGLAAACAVSNATVFLFPALAVWVSGPTVGLGARLRATVCLAAAASLSFLAANWYWLADLAEAGRELRMVGAYYSGGSPWTVMGIWRSLAAATGAAVLVGAVAGGVALFRRERRLFLILVLPAVLHVILTGVGTGSTSGSPGIARFLFPAAFVTALLCGLGLARLARCRRRIWFAVASILTLVLTLFGSAPLLISFCADRSEGGSRNKAGQWINENLPAGCSIGYVYACNPSYVPPLRFDRFALYQLPHAPDDSRLRPEYVILPAGQEKIARVLLRSGYARRREFLPRWSSSLFPANGGFLLLEKR